MSVEENKKGEAVFRYFPVASLCKTHSIFAPFLATTGFFTPYHNITNAAPKNGSIGILNPLKMIFNIDLLRFSIAQFFPDLVLLYQKSRYYHSLSEYHSLQFHFVLLLAQGLSFFV